MTFRQFLTSLATTLTISTAPAATTFTTTITVEPQHAIGAIPPGIYGQYLEHVEAHEETIYPSLWDDSHPHSNEMGLRTDVTSAVRELGTPVVRWPGGCFADVYHWEDAIGPRGQRQPKPNKHWGGTESNMFGTDEFLQWCQLANVEPYINVNLGSGTLDEALRWLEYANGSPDTPQGRRRADNGTTTPYGVRYWGIGNETWGPWETGHTDADTYGTSLSLWARTMRQHDPSLRILGVGSEEGNDRAWDSTVLSHAGLDIDLLTVHMYGVSTTYDGSEYEAFVFTPDYLENRLRRMLETVDQSTASLARSTPLNLSIDEWNIRHFFDGKQNRKSPRNLQDALFTASFLNGMIRLSPRIEMANYVFLVNGNATMLVNRDEILWTPLAHVFYQYTRWMNGTALKTQVKGPATTPPPPITGHAGRPPAPDYRPQPGHWIDTTAAINNNTITIAVVNRHPDQPADIKLNLGTDEVKSGQAWTLTADSPYAANTFDNPEKLKPVKRALTRDEITARTWQCPPMSITLLRYNISL